MLEQILNLPIYIYCIIGVLLLYFLLQLFFPKKKTKEQLEEDNIKKSKKKKTNYSETSISYIRESQDNLSPNDGTTSHYKGTSGVRKIDKKKYISECIDRIPRYQYLFNEQRETNLNHLARDLGIINDVVISDLKYLKKKKHLFQNVIVDIKTSKVTYTDDIDNIMNDNIDDDRDDFTEK